MSETQVSDISLDIPPAQPQPKYDIGKTLRQPGFWIGALTSRTEGRSLGGSEIPDNERRLEEARSVRGIWRRYIPPPIPERIPYVLSDDERRIHDEMTKALAACSRTKADVTKTRAFHRWLGQGTKPDETAEDEAEEAAG